MTPAATGAVVRGRPAPPAAARELRTSPARAPGVVATTITTRTDLEALGPEWDALFASCGRPQQVFQTFAWLRVWAEVYLDRRTTLHVVTGRVEGRLVAVWPLVVRRLFGLRLLTWMGQPVSQYGDALISDDLGEIDVAALVDHVLAAPVDLVALRHVREDAACAAGLRRRLGAPANRMAAPVVDFAGASDAVAFERRFAGKLKSNRRRRRRRLEERGILTFEPYAPSPEAVAAIAATLGFKRDWARRHGIVAPALSDVRFERFFVAAASAGPAAPELRVSLMRCGGAIVGGEISVACKGRLFGHVLAPCSDVPVPGLGGLLAERTIVSALEQGYEAIDLMAPADPYKLEWTTQMVGVGDHLVARSPLGALYARAWLGGGREKAKAVAARLRPVLAAARRRRIADGADATRPHGSDM